MVRKQTQFSLFPIFTTEYYSDDPVSFVLAFFSLAPILLVPCLFFYLLALWSHGQRHHPIINAGIFVYLPGCLLNAAVNVALKKTFAVKRPEGFFSSSSGRHISSSSSSGLLTGGKEGMPSHHAQLMAYLIFVAFQIRLFNLGRIRLFLISICTLLLVSYSRVYHHYHSWDQVAAGSLVGYLFGVIFINPIAHKLIISPYKQNHISHSPDD